MRATEERLRSELRAILGDDGLREREPLASHTTFRIGGPARWLALPSNEDEARAVVLACRQLGWPWRVLGLGSNVLASDEGLDEVVLKLAERFSSVGVEGAPGSSDEGLASLAGSAAALGVSHETTDALTREAPGAPVGPAAVRAVGDDCGDAVDRAADGAGCDGECVGERAAGGAMEGAGFAVVSRIGEDAGGGAVECATERAGEAAGRGAGEETPDDPAYRLVFAQAGATNAQVAELACTAGLSGYEFASGIPGTIGGAAVMNAGAYGGEFADVAVAVRCLTPEGEVLDVPATDAAWGYRTSLMMERGYVVLGAILRLTCDKPGDIRARMDDLAQRREDKQPLDLPSAGSTFKRPEGYFAGKLIQDAGLQGRSVGGAQVSTKHVGFVVNAGGATAADVRALIAQVQAEVADQFGVALEPEVRLWGFRG